MIQMKGMRPLDIKKGQIVHAAPVMMHSLCMDGRKVSRIHGGKVFYRDTDGHEHFVKLNAVMFVCDTIEESMMLEDLSRRQRVSAATAIRTIVNSTQRELQCIIEQSQEREAA